MNIDLVEKLVLMLQGSEAEELSVSAGELQVKIRRGPDHGASEEPELLPNEADVAAPAVGQESSVDTVTRITAGMVGIFHPAEGLSAGTHVEPRQVIGVIESMKLMNEVTSPHGGAVREMLAEDGSPVEFGQVLVTLEMEN